MAGWGDPFASSGWGSGWGDPFNQQQQQPAKPKGGGGGIFGGNFLDPSIFGYHLGIGNFLSGISQAFGGIVQTGIDPAAAVLDLAHGDIGGALKRTQSWGSDVGTALSGVGSAVGTAVKTALTSPLIPGPGMIAGPESLLSDATGGRIPNFDDLIGKALNKGGNAIGIGDIKSATQIAREPEGGVAPGAFQLAAGVGTLAGAGSAAAGVLGRAAAPLAAEAGAGAGEAGLATKLGELSDALREPSAAGKAPGRIARGVSAAAKVASEVGKPLEDIHMAGRDVGQAALRETVGKALGEDAGVKLLEASKNLRQVADVAKTGPLKIATSTMHPVGRALLKFQDEERARAITNSDVMKNAQMGIATIDGRDEPVTVLGSLGKDPQGIEQVLTSDNRIIPAQNFTPTPPDVLGKAVGDRFHITNMPDPIIHAGSWLAGQVQAVGEKAALLSPSRRLYQATVAKTLHEPDVEKGFEVARTIAKKYGVNESEANTIAGKLIASVADGTDVLRGETADLFSPHGSGLLGRVRGGELHIPEGIILDDAEIMGKVHEVAQLYRERVARNMDIATNSGRLGEKGLKQRDSELARPTPVQEAADRQAKRLLDRADGLTRAVARDRLTERGKVRNFRDAIRRIDDRIGRAHQAVMDLTAKIAADRASLHDAGQQAERARLYQASTRTGETVLQGEARAARGAETKRDTAVRRAEARALEADAKVERAKARGDQWDVIPALQANADDAVQEWADLYNQAYHEGIAAQTATRRVTEFRGQSAAGQPTARQETRAQAYSRGLRSGKLSAVQWQERALIKQRDLIQKQLKESLSVLDEHRTRTELAQAALTGRADKIQAILAKQLDHPEVSQVPAKWQPIYSAVKELHALAVDNPVYKPIVDALPTSLSGVIDFLHERGVEPVHVSEFSDNQVRDLIYSGDPFTGERRLGQTVEAASRQERTGTMGRSTDRNFSVEGVLGAGTVDVLREQTLNHIADHVDGYKRPVPLVDGRPQVPVNWREYGPHMAKFLGITGKEFDDFVEKHKGEMVPKAIANTLSNFSKEYSHWLFKAINKGVLKPWRLLIMKFYPPFYLHHFLRMAALATVGGARLRDFVDSYTAIRTGKITQFDRAYAANADFERTTTLPRYTPTAGERGPALLNRALHGPVQEGGLVRERGPSAANRFMHGLDEWARTADYISKVRKGMNAEEALHRTMRDLIDYHDLSPFEAQVMRNVIPFYGIIKGVYKIMAHLPIDHPLVFGLMQGFADLEKEKQLDMFGMLPPSAYQDLLDVPGVGPVNFTAFNPFKDTQALTTPWGIMDQLNPLLKVLVDEGTGTTHGKPDSYRLDPTGHLVGVQDPIKALREIVTTTGPGNLFQSVTGADLGGPGANQSPLEGISKFLTGIAPMSDEQLAKLQGRVIPNIAKAAAGPQATGTSSKSRMDVGQALAVASGYLNPAAFPGGQGTAAGVQSQVQSQKAQQKKQTGGFAKSSRRGGGKRGGRRRGGVHKAVAHRSSATAVHRVGVRSSRAGVRSRIHTTHGHSSARAMRATRGRTGGKAVGRGASVKGKAPR